jgi:predicted Zn-dependent protease
MLSGMLDILINGPSPNPEILWRAGFLNSMGHNLDIAGSAEKTSTIFKNLLAMSPSDPRGNYMYGTYLAGIGKPKDALPYLEKALFVGVADAAYTLGMTHLPDMQGSGNVRDLRQAASLSTTEGATLASALSQFSVATHSEQRSQLDALLTDWAATAGISDMATRHN